MIKKIEELVENAREWLRLGRFPVRGKPEALTRQYLITPLLLWLDWSDMPSQDFHFVSEFGEGMKRLWEDYVLLNSDRPIIFLESKSLFDEDLSPYVSELLEYMREYNRTSRLGYRVDWGILTNFREIRFYYVSDREPFLVLKIEELIEKQDSLRELLSVEGVKREGLEHQFSESRRETLGDQFLEDLKKWRLILANGYYELDQSLSVDSLKEASQQTLDRLIFIRMLETLGILPFSWLRNIYIRWKEGVVGLSESFSEIILKEFSRIESVYDTELFQKRLCDKLTIEDKYLHELMKVDEPLNPEVARKIENIGQQKLEDRGLYGYNFKTLTIDIIGSAYERYLAHDLKLDAKAKRVTIRETRELRKKEGVYYTPPYVVDYIVTNAVKPLVSSVVEEAKKLLKEKRFEGAKDRIEELRAIKVLDPACGSGSFLIRVFDIFLEGYKASNEALSDELRHLLNESRLTRYVEISGEELTIKGLGERILLDNVYGVDLDPQAVEITKLNLWLKVLSATPDPYRPLPGKKSRKTLPSLVTRIRVGNSLCSGLDHEGIDQLISEGTMRALAEKKIEVERAILNLTPQFNLDGNLTKETEMWKLLGELTIMEHNVDIMGRSSLLEKKLFVEEDGKLKGLTGQQLNWESAFPEVFLKGGFDSIIGNPPHGAKLTNEERNFFEKSYNLGKKYKNTAFLFLEVCQRKLRPNGKLGMVIPKSLVFSEQWHKVRKFLRENFSILEIADISKAFKKVLLEQVVLLSDKTFPSQEYFMGFKLDIHHPKPEEKHAIPFVVCDEVDAFPLLVDQTALEIRRKMYERSILLGGFSKTFRGFPYQSKLISQKGEREEPTLRGDDIRRFFLFQPCKYLDASLFKDKDGEWTDKTKEMKGEKIVAQRIVAHIKYPVDHVAIMAVLDKEGLVSVDTVENILVIDSKYDVRYILALLNSRLVGWYIYHFVFCNAIRTMDFDEYYVSKIPVVQPISENKPLIDEICNNVSELVDLAQQRNWMNQAFRNLTANYELNYERPLSHFISSTYASDYCIDLISTTKSEETVGTITGYSITSEEKCVKVKVELREKPPFEALQLCFSDKDVKDFFYLSLNRHQGRKTYKSRNKIVPTLLKDLTVPSLKLKAGKSNVEYYRKLMDEMTRVFSEISKSTKWASSPINKFDPYLIERFLEEKDETINSKVFRLYALTEEEVLYVKSRTPSLTRLI